jgi:hypothetical protein
MASGSAFADSFTFTSAGNVTWDNVYVNPYQATDNTQTQNNPLTIYCDDWNTEFSGNPTWNAGVYALTASNLSNFKYGNITSDYSLSLSGGQLTDSLTSVNAYNLYLEAAYLDMQLQTELASGDSIANKNAAQIDYSAANWTLFVDSSNVGGLISAINNTTGLASLVSTELTAAQTAVGNGFNAAGWDVIVPGNNTFAMQEFLVSAINQTAVPEPGSVILLGTIAGLLGLMKFRRKREV